MTAPTIHKFVEKTCPYCGDSLSKGYMEGPSGKGVVWSCNECNDQAREDGEDVEYYIGVGGDDEWKPNEDGGVKP